MATASVSTVETKAGVQASWKPMIVIAMAQVLMVFNVATLQVSIEGIASTFSIPATTIATAIVSYSLVVAAFILLGARIVQIFGSRRIFHATVALFGAAMLVMALSRGTITMIIAQVIAGIAAAALVPTLVVLVAENYKGARQAKALGWLGGAQPLGIVLAFLIAGSLATWIGWRFMFGLLTLFAAAIYKLSENLGGAARQPGVSIDTIGVTLVAVAVILVSVGCNNLTDWGGLLATAEAPLSLVDMSPAPIMIVCGIFLIQGFIAWSRRRERAGGTPLIALEVIDSAGERAAVFSMFVVGAIGSALTFLVPLYIQVVQGGSGLDTAAAVIPFSLASFAAAVLVVRLYHRVSPRALARYAFLMIAVAIALLGAVVRNDWSAATVILSMSLAGIGEGILVALLFNLLVAASPRELAGDVGSLRGCTNNLAAGVGTALGAALVVSLLTTSVHRNLVHNTLIPDELKSEVSLDSVPFVSNDQLQSTLANMPATPDQIAEAVRINTEARLQALKISLFALAGIALLAFFPAGGLPGHARAVASQADVRDGDPSQAPAPPESRPPIEPRRAPMA